jgi:ABC-type branched-subunit amino acid transport system substrate-binding protein
MAELSHPGQARRSILGLAAAALFAVALGGCQLVPGPRADRGPVPEPVEEVAEAEVEPARPGFPAGETRNRVAVLVPLTGANAGVGTSIANAANLAITDTGGDRIRITVYDTARTGGAAAAANQALAEGNGLILGPLLAEDVRGVAPIARRAEVPVIAFSNDVSVAGEGVYLMGFTPGQSIARVVSHARGEGLARFAGIAPEGVYGRRASEALTQAVGDADARLVGVQSFTGGAAGLRAALTRLNAAGRYEAILIGDSGRIAAAAAPMVRSGPGAGARILGTELWASENNLGRTAALRGAWYASVSDGMFDQLRSRYRTRFGANPYRLASLGYDAVLLAVRIAKDWRIGRNFPEGQLRDPTGFAGVDGAFRFGPDGIAERSLEVREITAAGTSVVSPAPRGFD